MGSFMLLLASVGFAPRALAVSFQDATHQLAKAHSHHVLLRRDSSKALMFSSAASETEPAALPATASTTPLDNCDGLLNDSATREPWKIKRWEAARGLCENFETRQFLESFLDTRFRNHYERVFTEEGGWVPEAYVNFVRVPKSRTYYGNLTEALVDSVHRFSTKPIIVVNFGSIAPTELDPERFPRLVLLHARSVSHFGVSFNFNKLLAILLAKVKVGISTDSDTMVGPHADKLFSRTFEEITEQYPFPMLPTHYLDRDPDNAPKPGQHRDNYFPFYPCNGCPKQTMRWGHAHPSWTFWAFPFVGRWLTAKLLHKVEQGVHTESVGEDEDLLNVGLWAENATKAWCMFQFMGTSWVWENFLPQHAPGGLPFWDDPSRFPTGVPLAFYMSHAEQKIEKVYKAMDMLGKSGANASDASVLSPYYHNGRFFPTFSALKASDPGLRCMF